MNVRMTGMTAINRTNLCYRQGWLVLLVLLASALMLSGCLQEAEDKCFTFDNTNDPEASGECTGGEPTETGDSGGTVAIVSVTTLNEVVVISNTGVLDQDMTDWTLENEGSSLPADIYTFPSFVLTAGNFVRVHSDTGTDDADDLYWDGAGHWDGGDTAVLKDELGSPISTCADGDPCWDGGT